MIADLLRARGFIATTTLQVGNLGCSDRDQLEYAIASGKALLTHNRADFEELAQQYFSTGQPHCGIIIAVRRVPNEIVRRLLAILNSTTTEEIQNQLLYI